MSGRVPTPEQSAAIAAGGRSMLVEAGAGTGKTGVMVDRYCRLVCDAGVEPEAVLAFTFTEKAAAELRQRIRGAVEERAATGSDRAGDLLPRLGATWVMTIHGFCNRLLTAHPVAAGIDPRFHVLDAPEAERAAGEAFDRALDEFLGSGDTGRELLVAAFDIAGLRAIVTAIHADLRSRGDAEPRLPEPPAPDLAAAMRRAGEVAASTLAELKPTNGHRERVERAAEMLANADEPPDLDSACLLQTDKGGQALAEYREAIDALVGRVAEANEGGEAYRHLADLLQLFSARFREAKDRRGGLDFEDLQLFAVRLLKQPEMSANYRRRFSHLLVDEFQDTNRLQMQLIEALHGPKTQLMVVGDELQSIYGFRHADVNVLRDQRSRIEAGGEGGLLELSGNFRSRPEIIGAVNTLGERLIGERFRPLRVGALPERERTPGEGPAVELLLTGRDGWDADGIELDPATDARTPLNCLAEARFVAGRLRELFDEGVDRGAMVVLLRAFTHLDAYEDSLERAGLRPYVVGGRGYWSQQQVADVCALLASIANPLDDQALFGALASPACAVEPDTLWLLRMAAGRGRHVWPAVERAAGLGEEELLEPELLDSIPAEERVLLGRFAKTLGALRRRAPLLSLPALIEAAVSETGYDLAVLMRRAGEARFANVRKLMRLAAEFEAGAGRDLRGLLDFLAARADADADAQAATAVEGHDGVRIMTTHSAKGLEFDVVAVPHLSRRLLRQARQSPLVLGREPEAPRVGMQLRRLGAPKVDLYAYPELCEEAKQREAEEELRLFHVAATRARERLILSGVVAPEPSNSDSLGTPVIERITTALGVDRGRDSTVEVAPPESRPGLDASFAASEIAVRVNLPSAERAAELTPTFTEAATEAEPGEGPAPLLERTQPPVPKRPLSYTAISAHAARSRAESDDIVEADIPVADDSDAESGAAHGIAVHSMLEWSQANGWGEPSAELVGRFARFAGLDGASQATAKTLLALFRAWTGSDFFKERVRPAERQRAEVPLLLELSGTVLRGSIDLLVERDGAPPLIVDYKTDRLAGADPAEWAARHYGVQRDLYALAVSEALERPDVEVAHVFLERPNEPVVRLMDAAELDEARQRLAASIVEVTGAVAVA